MTNPGQLSTLLIYAPVPAYHFEGETWIESQAVNGLRLWADQFGEVIAMMPATSAEPPIGWVRLKDQGGPLKHVRIESLPMAYRPDQYVKVLSATRRRIRALIDEADYLSFAIGGLFGDWGAVACAEAHRLGRPHAVWTDRVESEVTRMEMHEGPMRSRLRARLYRAPMARLERKTIQRADLGLFHGAATYNAYAGFSRNPHIVHDIHISREDHIPQDAIDRKLAAVADTSRPLKIVYAGRADPMKGPLDWLEVLSGLKTHGVAFEATWLGDGPRFDAMREKVVELGLDQQVSLPGFVNDRARVIAALRDADLFLFCHKTPESPRNLIEALISGCPIVGYTSPYAEDLISQAPGGQLVALNDVEGLTAEVLKLAADRARLGRMIEDAARAGEPFTDTEVYAHRAELIKTNLPHAHGG